MRVRVAIGTIACVLAIGFGWGFLSGIRGVFPYSALMWLYVSLSGDVAAPPGSWQDVRSRVVQQGDRTLRSLETLGYVTGHQPTGGAVGVVTHSPDLCWDGYNLYTSGHAPEAFLMNMDGEITHSWRYPIEDAWPDYEAIALYQRETHHWFRAELLPDGGLLAIFNHAGLIRIDSKSNLVWKFGGHAHHDVDVSVDGEIFVLTSEERTVPSMNSRVPVLDERITELDENGAPKNSIA